MADCKRGRFSQLSGGDPIFSCIWGIFTSNWKRIWMEQSNTSWCLCVGSYRKRSLRTNSWVADWSLRTKNYNSLRPFYIWLFFDRIQHDRFTYRILRLFLLNSARNEPRWFSKRYCRSSELVCASSCKGARFLTTGCFHWGDPCTYHGVLSWKLWMEINCVWLRFNRLANSLAQKLLFCIEEDSSFFCSFCAFIWALVNPGMTPFLILAWGAKTPEYLTRCM